MNRQATGLTHTVRQYWAGIRHYVPRRLIRPFLRIEILAFGAHHMIWSTIDPELAVFSLCKLATFARERVPTFGVLDNTMLRNTLLFIRRRCYHAAVTIARDAWRSRSILHVLPRVARLPRAGITQLRPSCTMFHIAVLKLQTREFHGTARSRRSNTAAIHESNNRACRVQVANCGKRISPCSLDILIH